MDCFFGCELCQGNYLEFPRTSKEDKKWVNDEPHLHFPFQKTISPYIKDATSTQQTSCTFKGKSLQSKINLHLFDIPNMGPIKWPLVSTPSPPLTQPTGLHRNHYAPRRSPACRWSHHHAARTWTWESPWRKTQEGSQPKIDKARGKMNPWGSKTIKIIATPICDNWNSWT